VLHGFAPEVVEVTRVSDGVDRVELELVDRWPDYEVVSVDGAAGSAGRPAVGRPEAAARMELVRTAEGWRIATAERLG
jgi:hypothetical protein